MPDTRPQMLVPRPEPRFQPLIFFAICALLLGCASYLKPEPYRAFYGGLAVLLVVAMFVQYRRERSLVANSLPATGIVTEHKVRGKAVPYFGRGVPIIEYAFVAFDQKTYHGETGWGAASLEKGAQIAILYSPENPARSHPVGGFVFYSFK